MEEESFHKFHWLLFKSNRVKAQRDAPPKEHILKSQRLGMVLGWVAGGDKIDIVPLQGVEFNKILNSVWEVVDVVNKSDELKMKFPDTYEEQIQIAHGFQKKLKVNFANCVDCIDCMLI